MRRWWGVLSLASGCALPVLWLWLGARTPDTLEEEEAVPTGQAQWLTSYPLAVCLDGSPGLYYLRRGHGLGRTRYHIFAEGGGFCQSHVACSKQAGWYLGSTRDDGKHRELDHPFFRTSPMANPLMWDWNHVYIRYCDGGYLSGNRSSPKQVGHKKVYYRGWHILRAVLDHLSTHNGMDSATDVVFSGCSSGGIHVFSHLDYLRDRLPPSVRVVGLADSGFYMDRPMFTPLKRFVIDGQGGSGMLNSLCVSDNKGHEERCLVGEVVSQYLQAPVFAWQSLYDLDQRSCEMSEECADSDSCVQSYGDLLRTAVDDKLLPNPFAGAFLDSCSRHCAGPAVPRDDSYGKTPLQAFAEWYAGGGRRNFSQSAPFPCHYCCHKEKVATF